MAGVLQHLRSSTLNKRPNPASMVDGQIAINYASGSPGAFFKDSNGNLVKVGPVHVGATAPNVSPASGGTAGNSLGEQWLDTSGGTYVFKIWDGATWRSEAGEFVNVTGDTMTGSLTMGPSANLIFEGSTDDGFETTLTVVDPTADRTITLPNVSGTVVTTGDSGTVTSTMIADGTIVNADISASAAIAGTKISPDFGSQTIQTSGIFSHALGSQGAPTITFTGDTDTGIYSPGANQVAITTTGTGRLFINSAGTVNIKGAGTAGVTQAVSFDGSAPVDSLVLTSGGNVGLGNNAPNTRLHVTDGEFTISTGGNASDNGGIINFGITTFSTFSPMATIQGLLSNAAGTELQGGLGFFTRPAGTAGQTLERRMTISSQGNVGIGIEAPGRKLTASADASVDTAIQTITSVAGSYIQFTDSTASSYIGTNSGSIVFLNPTTERARITSDGRLLVGTSSARLLFTDYTPTIQLEGTTNSTSSASLINNSNGAAGPTFFFAKSRATSNGGVTVVSTDDELGVIAFNGADGTDLTTIGATIKANVDGTPGNNDLPTRLVFSTTADGASSPTERMRIASDGRSYFNSSSLTVSATATTEVSVGTGTVDGVTLYNAAIQASASSAPCAYFRRRTSDGQVAQFRRDGTEVGNISVTTTATAYNTSSDYRLKENVTAVTDGITRLQQLKPSRFNFIADPAKTVDGFLAHEVQAIVPEAVTGEKDAVDDEGNPQYQGIDQSKLVPLLTAALQEAVAKIESLEARLTAAGI